jgi:peptide deformylase
MVRRPLGIKVSYLNMEGDEVESELYDFHARMFLHELDHINGKSMTHWKLSEGNIDILETEKHKYKNFMGVTLLLLLLLLLYIDN